MTGTPISSLPNATTPLGGAEAVPIVQNGQTVQAPATAFGVQGPGAVTSGHLAVFNGASGFLLSDGGPNPGAINGAIASNGSNTYTQAATTNLSDVSSGSWTPADNSGASLAFTGVSAAYTKIGNMVFAYASFTYPSTANGSNASISGLPFTTANAQYARQGFVTDAAISGLRIIPTSNAKTADFLSGTGSAVLNSSLSTTAVLIQLIYPVS